MKVIFLDFDGVLNCEKYIQSCEENGVIIDPAKMLLLKKLINATEAEIVLTTSWREHWDKHISKCDNIGIKINEIFKKYDLEIFDKTTKLKSSREAEIKDWLNKNIEVGDFVVLDDAFLSADYLDGHFVKTSNYFGGLDKNDVKKAIEILNE